jgi:predicted  nucleic acid-binding Zn-ribbon protein
MLDEKDEQIQELQYELDSNKEKIRMNSQLTQALSDSVNREQELKKQCDQLLESLHSALSEDEKLTSKIIQMENNIENLESLLKSKDQELSNLKLSKKPNNTKINTSELAKIIENNIEEGANKWQILKYSHLEGLSDKDNFELIRKVLEYKDKKFNNPGYQNPQDKDELEALRSTQLGRDLNLYDIDSKKQSMRSQSFEEALAERENDIKDLLKDYENLQMQYQSLEKEKANMEYEALQLREKLAYKSNQLVNIYQNQEFNSQIPQEFNTLKSQYLELINNNQYLQSQLSVIRSKGKNHSEVLQQYFNSDCDKSTLIEKLDETFKSIICIEIDTLETEVTKELRTVSFELEKKNLELSIENESLRIDVIALKNLLEEEKKIDSSKAKGDWKKFKRDHIARIEKIYQEQLSELKAVLNKFSGSCKEKEKKFIELSNKYENEIKELTSALKKEHESKKMIADYFSKEKDNYERIKENNLKNRQNEEVLVKKYNEAKYALEESNKKIFKLEQALAKNLEVEEVIQINEKRYKEQIEDQENSKNKLYSEITRLNKLIQDFEMEKNKLLLEKKSALEFCEESKENSIKELNLLKEEIQELQKENRSLKNEIFETDFKLKSTENNLLSINLSHKTENDLEKLKSQKSLSDKEKLYIESENKSLREDLKTCQLTINHLKLEIKNLSSDLQETQNELLISQRSKKESQKISLIDSSQYQEELSSIQNRLYVISKDFNSVKQELDKATEEKKELLKHKKYLESEILNQKSKYQDLLAQKEEISNISDIKEKVQEIEMKYESLEASQDEMILNIRKLYKDWCGFNNVQPKRFLNHSDPTREAISITEHIVNETYALNSSPNSDPIKEFIAKAQSLLINIEKDPDSIYKSYTLKLLSENILLKQELMEKHFKAISDEKIFKEFKDIKGINEWTLQKWKDSEKDVSRLREQLLQVTLELEKRIKITKEPPQDLLNQLEKAKLQIEQQRKNISEFEYLGSEKEYYKQRNIDLEQDILKLNSEKIETKQITLRLEKEKDLYKKSFIDLYIKLTNKNPDNENPLILSNYLFNLFDAYKDKNKSNDKFNSDFTHLRKQAEFYQQENKRLEETIHQLKNKEILSENKFQDMHRQGDSGLISALYEEKRLREELEEELTEKCNLIERILKEFDENKKYLKL